MLLGLIPRDSVLESASQIDADQFSEEGIENLVISFYAGVAAEIQVTGSFLVYPLPP